MRPVTPPLSRANSAEGHITCKASTGAGVDVSARPSGAGRCVPPAGGIARRLRQRPPLGAVTIASDARLLRVMPARSRVYVPENECARFDVERELARVFGDGVRPLHFEEPCLRRSWPAGCASTARGCWLRARSARGSAWCVGCRRTPGRGRGSGAPSIWRSGSRISRCLVAASRLDTAPVSDRDPPVLRVPDRSSLSVGGDLQRAAGLPAGADRG